MKKTFSKVISIFLSVVMLCVSMSALAFAADAETNDIPVIFVDGIDSTDIINTETGETAFPPSASSIVSGVGKAVLPLISSVLTKNYSKLADPVSEAVKVIFDAAACDENGDPVYATTTAYERPTEEEILAAYKDGTGYTASDAIFYSYDWRLDMQTLAEQLHDFIEYTLETTGAEKVNLIGFSMGTCVIMTYMNDYDYEYINNVVLLAGAYNGVSTCGEPFSGQIAFDDEAMVRFLYTMLGEDFGSYLLKAVIDALYQAGVVDGVLDFATELVDAILDDVYEDAFKETFARMAGFWSLIPYDMYDDAKALLIGDNVTEEYIAKIDYYHYEIQANNAAIIDGARDNGIGVSIVAKYGSTVPPCIVSINEIGDSVIDTKFESFGATCALANTTLGEDYVQSADTEHNHISPDNMIDASTCQYPENTWFIKGLNHADHNDSEWALCDFLLNSETQPTVWDNEAYPQFLTLVDGEFVPMTEENASNTYAEVTEAETGFFAKIIHVIKLIISAFKSLFSLL
ncbi:MAG: alpha/beta fold hydrolase [Clostridiales bacterium]|nr:alpha/beta fold hydrolase [Clostridiales bacterium]